VAAAFAAGLLLLVLRVGISGNERVPDFDLAIDNYQQSLTNFRPNVPSSSLATVLTAYIERGMPSYMWDFGPQGFKLVGGRFERLADGTPITYTWFRGTKAGVMCMFKQVSGFEPPAAIHHERDHLLFYRYRGYSVCLINVGGVRRFYQRDCLASPGQNLHAHSLRGLGDGSKEHLIMAWADSAAICRPRQSKLGLE
jgi:hypothetical protein